MIFGFIKFTRIHDNYFHRLWKKIVLFEEFTLSVSQIDQVLCMITKKLRKEA